MFSSTALLMLLCCCTLLLFGDRGAISSSTVSGDPGQGIRRDFDLSVAESGYTYAATMVGLALSAPAAAHLSSLYNALRLVGTGVSIAASGALGTALSPNLFALLLSRMLLGIGCGPFISLAAPLIDDSSPKARRSASLAALFVCLPVGFASGYIWASLIASHFGWRAVFFLEAAFMAPLAAIALLIPHPNDIKRTAGDLPGTPATSEDTETPLKLNFFDGIKMILGLPSVVVSILAMACFNGALGGFSFYGSKAAAALFALPPATADLLFGGATVACGVLGTLGGGIALDALGPSVRSALLLCILTIGTASVTLAVAFSTSKRLWSFTPGFAIGETALFGAAAPATTVLMWSVPSNLRPTVLALSELANHVLGDVPIPPLLGLLQERSGSWRAAMCACTAVLGLAAGCFTFAKFAVVGGVPEEPLDLEESLVEGEEEVVEE